MPRRAPLRTSSPSHPRLDSGTSKDTEYYWDLPLYRQAWNDKKERNHDLS